MTDAIAVATAAEVASAKQEAHKDKEFGHARSADSPASLDPAENTVILKGDSDDSELEDLRPLAEIHAQPQHQDLADAHCDTLQSRLVTNAPSNGYHSSSIDTLDSSSEDIQIVRPSPRTPPTKTANGARRSRGDLVASESARRNDRISKGPRVPRSGKERSSSEGVVGAQKPKIFVKLRRRPPAIALKDKARPMDEKAKAEMCKRLAKARAKKAELKEIARREKEERLSKIAEERTAMDKTNAKAIKDKKAFSAKADTQSREGGARVVAADKSVIARNSAAKAGTPKTGMPNSSAAVTQIAALQGVVPSLKAASARVNFRRDSGAMNAELSRSDGLAMQKTLAGTQRRTTEVQQSRGNIVVSVAQAAVRNPDTIDKLSKSNTRALHGDGVASPRSRGMYPNVTNAPPSVHFAASNATGSPRGGGEVPPCSPKYHKPHSKQDGTAIGEKQTSAIQSEDTTGRLTAEQGDYRITNYPSRPRPDSPTRDKMAEEGPMTTQFRTAERMGRAHNGEIANGLRPTPGRELPEQFASNRQPPIAISDLFQHSSRSGVSSPMIVSANWNESMKHDAKNEALFTLAEEQKGGIRKRKSSGRAPSGNFETNVANRSSKGQHRTNNVPESEKKRIHLTAMIASGRARGAGSSMAVEPSTGTGRAIESFDDSARKGSINRLLSSPSPIEHPDARDPSHGSESYNIGSPIHMQTRPAQRMNRSPAVNAQADTVMVENGALRLEQGSLRSPWEEPAEYEGLRGPPRTSGIASSNSGSQSEHGSTAARMPTSVHTLRKPRKRKTLALAAVAPTGSMSIPAPARADDPHDVVGMEQNSAAGGPAWGNVSTASGGYRQPGHSHSSHEFDVQGGSMKPTYLERTPDVNSRRGTEFERRSVGSPPTAFNLNQYSRADLYANERSRHVSSNREVGRYPAPETDLSRGGMDEPYQSPSLSTGRKGGEGIARSDAQMTHNQISPMRRLAQNAPSQGYPSPVFPGEYHTGRLDDGSRFADGRRLRRSAAPTVPTATRRYQYEQGRQLARFTYPGSPPEAQQPYSTARRPRTGPNTAEPAFAHSGTDYGQESKGDPRSFGQPAYPPFSHEDSVSNTHTLNHHAIAHGGMRLQLAPIIRPESPLHSHTRDLTWRPPGLSRYGDTKAGPIVHRSGEPQRYHGDYAPERDERSTQMGHYRAMQPQVGSAPDAQDVYDRSREYAVAPMPSAHDERAFGQPEAGQVAYGMDEYGRRFGFSDRGTGAIDVRNAGLERGQYAREQAAKQSQRALPARTDPSLKNLLG
ncbi:unnamed protein product [Chondrus crispus]|uniref:Uncharacterized protein n=1 Tax=Chondrus crispus TaxID=2769 RepID=R7Q4M1_CHOCR|nr:unnamed protein product [Chondrus crispus]CDF32316.1 unnamed protein product [Chondrus crispus]|eukprot:XP_005711981.1 unnamed protein product [Chondrus crispus]